MKGRARREGFEYVARCFENSLEGLKKSHAGLDVDFHRLDADAFTCAVYHNGNKMGLCGIWRGNQYPGMGDVCYSQDSAIRNGINESLILDDNEQTLGFGVVMGSYGRGNYSLKTSRRCQSTNPSCG